jgi:GDPmannose 4,6-dehydratase
MLQMDEPDDFVVGTGESRSVREFVEEAFAYAGLDWKSHVELDERYLRPTEADNLQADAAKARRKLGWSPKIGFHDLVRIMMDAELERVGAPFPGEGVAAVEKKFGGWHTPEKVAAGASAAGSR